MQSRFEFLEEQFPKLAGYGKNAEEALNSDNNICLLNLGRIAETITETLRSINNIDKDLEILEALKELLRIEVIDDVICLKIKTLIEIKKDAEESNYNSEMSCERLMTTAQELCEWFVLKQIENKFEFLAELYPPDFIPPLVTIAELGREAELNLRTNTRYCLICLGDAGEAIVDYLISANNISAQRDHLDRINVLFNLGVIKNDKKDELHNLRIARNNAVHERYNNTYTSEEEAGLLIEDVLKLCRWLYKLVLKPGDIIKGKIAEIKENSISVLIGTIPAEVPLEQIPEDENGSLKNSYIKGKKYLFKVIENDKEKIILSLREADENYKAKIQEIKRKYSTYNPGQELKVKIIKISSSAGALVELKNGLPAQIPPAEIVGRKLYSIDASGTKHIKYDVTARVKYINAKKYPPMQLTLKDPQAKKILPVTSQQLLKMRDIDFVALCRNAGPDKILKALDQKNADPNAKGAHKLTALMEAARFNNQGVIKILLDAGAEINAVNREGNTALHYAAMQNSHEAVEELIKRGANINALNKKKHKPVFYAGANKKLRNYPYIIELLKHEKTQASKPEIHLAIQSNSDNLETTNGKGMTTVVDNLLQKNFLKTCRSGSSAEIAEAIAAGVNVNVKNKELRTALMFAALYNTAEAVSYIIEAGAYIDAQDIYGRTALIYAASRNTDDVVELLIDAGAELELKDTSGFSALDYGKKNHRLIDTEAIKRLAGEN